MLQVQWVAKSVVPEKSGGTAICEAIRASANQFSPDDSPRAVVLISDGQNNAGCLLEDGVAYANSQNTTVFAIGVGSLQGGEAANIPGIKFTLDDTDLKRVAEGTGGQYFRAESPGQLYDALAYIGRNAVRDQAIPLDVPVMMVAFALVFVDWGLLVTRYRTIP
jgi:Ca-activated chloride channel family protein